MKTAFRAFTPRLLATTGVVCALLGGAGASLAQSSAPRQVQACTDFDAYVNAEWQSQTQLLPHQARTGSFDVLRDSNTALLSQILTKLLDDAKASRLSPGQAKDPMLRALLPFVEAAMNEERLAVTRFEGIRDLLNRIERADREDLGELMGDFAAFRISLPAMVSVAADARDLSRHVLYIRAAGLGLPTRDDYFKTDTESIRLQTAYRLYVRSALKQLSPFVEDTALSAQVDALMLFETALAERYFTPAQARDPAAQYNPRTIEILESNAPGLNWGMLLARASQGAKITPSELPLNLQQPEAARAFAKLAAEAPMEVWRNYLRMRLFDELGDKLHPEMASAHFDYHRKALRGLQVPEPRMERLIQVLSGPFGNAPFAHALGTLYVRERFDAQAQARADQMVQDIRSAMRRRMQALPWMSDTTRAEALIKLDAMVAQIGAAPAGGPHEASYAQLPIYGGNYARQHLESHRWALRNDLSRMHEPVQRERWITAAHTVNAFAAGGNRIVFPAGILQPPFFDASADDASNYGGIGMVIGHEITHHFDDRGRQFDSVGNLRDWWTTADAKAYRERASKLAAFYSAYEPTPGHRINGEQTLGENISDVAGIQIAFDGLQIALARQRAAGQNVPLINGQTPEQRFFLAHARLWRNKQRVEALINQLRTGNHSPARYRVLGPLAHSAAFAQAFGCQPGDAMLAKEPVVIW